MRTLLTIVLALGLAAPVAAYVPEDADSGEELEYLSEEPYPDIELWLGEKVGRYGDFEFRISGGSPQYPTPKGAFQIEWKSRHHWSKQWDAPMPYAQFFKDGAAIHKGDIYSSSKGCVRVTEETARRLFPITKEKRTRVFVYP